MHPSGAVPPGLPAFWTDVYPALKRWASQRCASGAVACIGGCLFHCRSLRGNYLQWKWALSPL